MPSLPVHPKYIEQSDPVHTASESPRPHPLFLHLTTLYASLTESPEDDSYKVISSECENLMTHSLLFGKFHLMMMCPVLSSPLMDMGVSPLHCLRCHQRPGSPRTVSLAGQTSTWSPADSDWDRSRGQASICWVSSVILKGASPAQPCPIPFPFCPSPQLSDHSSLWQERTSASHIPALSFHTPVLSRQV